MCSTQVRLCECLSSTILMNTLSIIMWVSVRWSSGDDVYYSSDIIFGVSLLGLHQDVCIANFPSGEHYTNSSLSRGLGTLIQKLLQVSSLYKFLNLSFKMKVLFSDMPSVPRMTITYLNLLFRVVHQLLRRLDSLIVLTINISINKMY